MTIICEDFLYNFEFWSSAKETAKYLTWEEFSKIEAIFENIYPDGMTDVQINDIFWFDDDWIAEMLGYNSFKEIIDERSSLLG